MSTFLLVMLAVIGMMMAMFGLCVETGSRRLAAWGLAICVGALTTGLRVLQKQIDDLKASKGETEPQLEGTN